MEALDERELTRVFTTAAKAVLDAFRVIGQGELPLTGFYQDTLGRVSTRVLGEVGRPGTAERRQELLHTDTRHNAIRFLMYSRTDHIPDCTMKQALHVEFGAVTPGLKGLALVLPFGWDKESQMITGMLQAVAPEGVAFSAAIAARMRVNDVFVTMFGDILGELDERWWVRALQYDRREQPSQERVENSTTPVPLCCESLDLTLMNGDSNQAVRFYLDALVDRYPFEDGISFRKALYQLDLDFTVDSLFRVDYLLGKIGQTLQLTPQQFMARQANMNFLYCLAAYCTDVIAKSAGARVAWYSALQCETRYPEKGAIAPGPAMSLIGIFNEGEEGGGQRFPPVALIVERLFGKKDSRGFRMALKAMWNNAHKSRPWQLNDQWPMIKSMFATAPTNYLSLMTPSWTDNDPMGLWYQAFPKLFQNGRLVWGALVQANGAMWGAGDFDAPGEVLYDPRGLITNDELSELASRLYQVKHCRIHDPRVAFFSDYLTHERTRSIAARLPYSLSSGDLCCSSLMFIRKHLLGGRLQSRHVPLLIHDEHPGVVTVLPVRFWTESLKAECFAFGWNQR